MDFLDPKKERRNRLLLLIGYCFVALAIGIATLVLLYQSYGYGIDRQGNVTQNGIVFASSQPSGAAIYLSGKRYKSNTDTRMVVPAGSYTMQISATGYRSWQRPIVVAGGDVQHFDYPFLFPQQLKTSSVADLNALPSAAIQSLDRRWLLLTKTGASGVFTEYDFKNPAKPVATEVALPSGSFTPGDGQQTWSQVEWATDNRHVLLLHGYQSGTNTNHEYVLLDRDAPENSLNVTSTLKLSANQVPSLYNNRVEQFYVYDASSATLERVNAADASVVSTLTHVLAFKTYAADKLLYIADQPPSGKATPNQVSAVLQDGQKTITLRTLPAGASSYSLNLAQYSGDWYIAVAATNDSSVYVYKNPQTQVTKDADGYPDVFRRLPLSNPSYLAFSSNTQFLLAENGQDFAVFDFENIDQYHYRATAPLDQPQTHATWMDGDRLTYVSEGKLQVFDYDHRNQQTLVDMSPNYLPFFSSDYKYLYALRAGTTDGATKSALTSTPLVIKP
jgi:hypothetical protein